MPKSTKQNKKYPILIFMIVFVGSYLVYQNIIDSPVPNKDQLIAPSQQYVKFGKDPLNSSYIIEGDIVSLSNGVFEQKIPNSSSVTKYKNYNSPVKGSLVVNNGSNEDASFILVQEGSGSAIFYYIVASVGSKEGYKGTNGVLIGDRIKPESVNINNSVITVKYLDRTDDSPMSDSPSIVKTTDYVIKGGELVEKEEIDI